MKTQKIELTKGTRVFYHGDMANEAGHATITEIIKGKFGTQYLLHFDDGREFCICPSSFSPEYLGHGGTRFVTEATYNKWRNEQIARFA